MKPVSYKFVLDNHGLLNGVELWQGNEHITISMMSEGLHKNGYRWSEIKDFIDNVRLPVYSEHAVFDKAVLDMVHKTT